MKKLIGLTLVLVVTFSCTPDRNDIPPRCTTDAASIAGSYKITAYTYKESATKPEVDYYSTLYPDPCDRDNVLKFNANGTYELIDAGMVCSPAGGDNGTWALVGNSIQIDGTPVDIESFDCNKLVLARMNMLAAGDKLKITLIK